jgi:hypothetical protein
MTRVKRPSGDDAVTLVMVMITVTVTAVAWRWLLGRACC